MALGTVAEANEQRGGATFLSFAGGFIWNRKATKDDPNYAEQKWFNKDKKEEVRCGAQYADLTGMITDVKFTVHKEYGENINVTVEDGEDKYILSMSIGNKYSQSMMKALLVMDLDRKIFIKPYDFVDKKTKKRVQGISFRQNNEKLDLRNMSEDMPMKSAEWFQSEDTTPSDKTIFFIQLNQWFKAEIQTNVCPILVKKAKAAAPKKEIKTPSKEEQVEEKVESKKVKAIVKDGTPKKVTPLKMRRFLTTYIDENYEDQELPDLDSKELKVWYDIAMANEELPFDNIDDDLDSIDDCLK